MAFEALFRQLGPLLTGPARREIIDVAAREPLLGDALSALADAVATHTFDTLSGVLDLSGAIDAADQLTRAEGFHAMHDWNGPAVRVNDDMIAVDVLRFTARACRGIPTNRTTLAIGLDYYFMQVLGLLSLRVWDADGGAAPNARIDQLGATLIDLQGPQGSGHRFANDAETLMLLATSHYEPNEHGYSSLLAQVRTLDRTHQLAIAIGHAASMGCHLRFGFEATYGKNAALMREDNVVDYPWLRYAVLTLLRALHAPEIHDDRAAIVEALAGGLTADAPALINDKEIMALFMPLREQLMPEFEALWPKVDSYSPQSLFFNFSFNVVKGAVVDAMLRGTPHPVSLNDFLSALATPSSLAPVALRQRLAVALMDYARKNPDRIRGQMMPVIVYDPMTARRVYGEALRALAGAH